jgi:hypothetical protein
MFYHLTIILVQSAIYYQCLNSMGKAEFSDGCILMFNDLLGEF